MKLYPCDPNKNTECKKKNCGYLKSNGTCFSTTNPNYAKGQKCPLCQKHKSKKISESPAHGKQLDSFTVMDRAIVIFRDGIVQGFLAINYCPECGRKLED